MTPSKLKLSSNLKYLNLTKKCLSVNLLQEKYDIKKGASTDLIKRAINESNWDEAF